MAEEMIIEIDKKKKGSVKGANHSVEHVGE